MPLHGSKASSPFLLRLRKFGCPVFAVVCSNQFGFQEPGNSEQIKNFASGKGFKGLLMEKIDVNGPKASPVYSFLKVCLVAKQSWCGCCDTSTISTNCCHGDPSGCIVCRPGQAYVLMLTAH